jgi:glutathione S-transferase
MLMNHYTLYGRRNAGSLAPQIVLEEIGAQYELIWVGRSEAELESLRRINPAGKVPALVLPDGTAISESAAILIHLTEAHPHAALAPAVGTSEHARFLQWMVFLSSNLYEAVLRYYYPERYSTLGEPGAGAVRDQALLDCDRHLARVHEALSPFLLGQERSAADVYLHMLASWYPGDGAELRARLPRLARLSDLVRERPATAKAEACHAET